MESIFEYLREQRCLVDQAIAHHLPCIDAEPKTIHACMHYATAGGKRLRPILTLAVGGLLSLSVKRLLPTCTAIEFIHTHSLILDDMPCMDGDDFRRGRLASHKVFGESTALLAADALLNLAIALLGANHRLTGLNPEIALDIIQEVSETVGTNGMIGAQASDLSFYGLHTDMSSLERIHIGKTAKLFRLSARVAALVATATRGQLEAVSCYAENLGFAFQIIDDILDHAGSQSIMRVTKKPEPNYAAVLGVEASRELAAKVVDRAILALSPFGDEADTLRLLAMHNLQSLREVQTLGT